MKKNLRFLVLLLLLGSQALGQSLKIRGVITDDSGQALPGATVILVRTSQGVITDNHGNYSFSANVGDTILFSFIGYQNQTKVVSNNNVINVKLLTDAKVLEEVVVVGYGTQKKATVVGAITQASADDIKKQGNVTNISDALTGSMPGVTILSQTGLPGGGGTLDGAEGGYYKGTGILIRGKSTWNNSSPLVLVDGVEREMNDIDINEVLSITVLKDASATAVFGMKGGNGVILITSKRGIAGKPKLSFEANQSFEFLSKYPEMVDSYNALISRNRAIINEVDVNPDSWKYYQSDAILQHYKDKDMPYAFPDNDWRDIMLRDFASSFRFNMNVSGGTKSVKYFGSLSYNHSGDILASDNVGQGYDPSFAYDRFNFRTNFDFTLTKTTQFSVNLSGIYGRQKRSAAGVWGIYSGIVGHTPHWPVIRYEDGVYGNSQELYETLGNNEYVKLNFSGTNVDNRLEANSDFALTQKLDFITEGLQFKAKLAYDNFYTTKGPAVDDAGVVTKTISQDFYLNGGYYNNDTKQYEMDGKPVDMVGEGYAIYYYPTGATDGFEWVRPLLGYDTEDVNGAGSRNNLYYEASLNYAQTFGKSSVSALALFSRQKTEHGSGWPRKREDWVGRMTYDYDNRYFAEVNGAYNGSEQFGPGHKFDFFPSFAFGWNIANERFMKHLPIINFLKVKYSNGVVGNDRVGGDSWGYMTVWSSGSPWSDSNVLSDSYFGKDKIKSYRKYLEGVPGNVNLRWEKARKQNVGIELEMLKGMISGSADFFNEYRYDMLVAAADRSIPFIYGQTPSAANIGEVKSHGAEIQLSVSKRYKSGFDFKLGGSWTYTKNKVQYKEDPELKPFYQKQAGYPIGQIRLQQQTEFIQSWDDMYNGVNGQNNEDQLPGDFRFMDYNANGFIDPDDGAPYGHPVYPANTYTANLNVGYKGWNLSALFYGTYNATRKIDINPYFFNSATTYWEILNATWTPEYGNSNPTYPHLSFQKKNNTKGTANYYDGSLLRLKSLELSYTLPQRWAKAIRASNVRVYANGNNLFVFTKMPTDGEGSNFSDQNYPLKKMVTIGLNVQF